MVANNGVYKHPTILERRKSSGLTGRRKKRQRD